MPRRVIIGQDINPQQIKFARELRQRMTPAERILWEVLRRSALGVHFRRQQVIAGYIADFYRHSASLVIELDGDVHDKQRGYDRARDDELARRKLRVLRIRNESVLHELPAVIDQIRLALATPPT